MATALSASEDNNLENYHFANDEMHCEGNGEGLVGMDSIESMEAHPLDILVDSIISKRQELARKRSQFNEVATELFNADKALYNVIQDGKSWKQQYSDALAAYVDVNTEIAYTEAQLDANSRNIMRISEDIVVASKNRTDVVSLFACIQLNIIKTCV